MTTTTQSIDFECALDRGDFKLDAAFSARNGVLALFGPSGSGKSTILSLIAGIERPDRGRIAIAADVVVDTSTRVFVPPHRRGTGLVFQDGQLFPHMSVRQNLAYASGHRSGRAPALSFDDTVALLDIAHLMDRKPATLSGGERQRVAIGRALLSAPRILLFDEPLASLDSARKSEILPFIERLRDEVKTPIVYVSHALDEVARLATTVVRLDKGRVRAIGPTAEILGQSDLAGEQDRFDIASILHGTITEKRADYGVTILAHPAGEIVVPADTAKPIGAAEAVLVRATNVMLARAPSATEAPAALSARTRLHGRISRIDALGGPFAAIRIELPGGDRLTASATRLAVASLGLAEGQEVLAWVKVASFGEPR